jgi:hypothetical protein
MDAYYSTMDALGESIVKFVDPNNEFTGYTDVSCFLGENCTIQISVSFSFSHWIERRKWVLSTSL